MRHKKLAVAAIVMGAAGAGAQSADTTRAGYDSTLSKARQLVQAGKEVDGRRILDSLLTITSPDSARFAEVLYWHGVYAATAAEAERDYRRLLIEAPLSPRAEDSLLRLAQLEQARGDRRGASDHLQRFLLTYPQSPARPRISVQLVRLLFDQGPQQLARACDVLHTARAEIPASSVELRNQLEAQVPRCAYVDTQAPAATPVDSTPVAPPIPAAPADTAKQPAASSVPAALPAPRPAGAQAPPPTVTQAPAAQATPVPAAPAAPTAFYSVQLAAYDSQESATRLVQQLSARGIDARVDGAKAPYRVRVGKYPTRADAAKAAADLKAKGNSGFITLVGPPAK